MLELCRKGRETRSAGCWLEVYHYVHGRQPISSVEATEDLSYPSFEAMAHHRVSDFATGRDSEPDILRLVGVRVKRGQRTVSSLAAPVATNVV